MSSDANGSSSAHRRAYRRALELALQERYGEAAAGLTKLLKARPRHVPSLILLGKVEYYLRRFASSRRRFEQALSLEPHNPAAWFGLQYYVQRRLTAFLLGALAIAVGALVLAGSLFAGSVGRGIGAELRQAEERLAGRLLAVERSLAVEVDSRQRLDRALLDSVEGLSAELRRYGGDLETRERGIQTAFAAVSDGMGELSKLQAELDRNVRAEMRELRALIGELRGQLQGAPP